MVEQSPGHPADPLLVVRTTDAFMDQWAAGALTWDDGFESGDVELIWPRQQWRHWLAASGYLLAYRADENAA